MREDFFTILNQGGQFWSDPRSWSRLLRFQSKFQNLAALWLWISAMIQRIVQVSWETFFERPPAQEGRSATIFHDSKNLASSSRDLRLDISETARREKWKENRWTRRLNHFSSKVKVECWIIPVELKVVYEQPILRSSCSCSKKLK